MYSESYKRLMKLYADAGVKQIYQKNTSELLEYISTLAKSRSTDPPEFIIDKYSCTEFMALGRPCHIISPKRGSVSDCAVFFIHGSGMFLEAGADHWLTVDFLIEQLGATVYLPAYPLLPHVIFSEVVDMLMSCYGRLLEDFRPSQTVFFGDSVGGALALMCCHRLKAADQQQNSPLALFLSSPACMARPLPHMREVMREIDAKDPMLSIPFGDAAADLLCQDKQPDDYHKYPFSGDFSGFPPCTVFFGTNEVLYAYWPELKASLEKYNVTYEFILGEGLMHDFAVHAKTDEGLKALKHICFKAKEYFARKKIGFI